MIFISVGHGYSNKGKDVGAVHKNVLEHSVSFTVAYSCYQTLYKIRDIQVIFVPPVTLQEKVEFINKRAKKDDIAIEFHFNSLPKDDISISFSEIIVFKDINKEKNKKKNELIKKLRDGIESYRKSSEFCKYYPASVRISTRDDLYFLKNTICLSVILEVDFIWNAEKIDKFMYGEEIAKALL